MGRRVLILGLFAVVGSPIVSSLLLAKGRGGRATCVGGTVAAVSSRTEGLIDTTDPAHFVFQAKAVRIQVPYAKVNLLEYGQTVSRRYALGVLLSPVLLLSKSRKHFLTVAYTDAEERQQALVFRVHKDDVRGTLVSLEVKTGLKVHYQDEEARKAGKG